MNNLWKILENFHVDFFVCFGFSISYENILAWHMTSDPLLKHDKMKHALEIFLKIFKPTFEDSIQYI